MPKRTTSTPKIVTHMGACTSSKRKNQAMRRTEKRNKKKLMRKVSK